MQVGYTVILMASNAHFRQSFPNLKKSPTIVFVELNIMPCSHYGIIFSNSLSLRFWDREKTREQLCTRYWTKMLA